MSLDLVGYVLRAPVSLARAGQAVFFAAVGVAGFLVARMFFDVHMSGPMTMFAVAGVALGVWRGLKRPVLLKVDGDGVRIGAVAVPWSSVGQLVLVRPEPVAGAFRTDLPPQVGVRLARGAPLPEGMDSVVFDPNDPLAIPDALRSQVVRPEIDADAVLAAARACAPADVVLVERVGDDEQVWAGTLDRASGTGGGRPASEET